MPRIPRGQMPGLAYHVLHRGNGRATLLHKDADSRTLCDLLDVAKKKFPVELPGFCVMPHHFHLGLSPRTVSALTANRLMTTVPFSIPEAQLTSTHYVPDYL